MIRLLTIFLLSFQWLFSMPQPEDQARALLNPNYYLHVTLTGVVKYMIFPGPPNFFSVEKGDWEEPRWILEVDEPSLKRLVETQASATPDNYLGEFIDTTIQANEPNANLVTLDSSFTGEPHNIGLYRDKTVTIDAVIGVQLTRCHTPFVVEIVKVMPHE